MKRFAQKAGVAMLALTMTFGVSACSDDPETPAKVVIEKPKVDTAEVKASLDAFFADVSAEAAASIKEKSLSGNVARDEGLSEDQELEKFHTSYAKSFSHIDLESMSSDDGDALVGSFAILSIFSPGAVIEANEDGFVIANDKAMISGSDLTMKTADGDTRSGDSESSPGNITLESKNGKWMITSYEVDGSDLEIESESTQPSDTSTTDAP